MQRGGEQLTRCCNYSDC